MKKASIAILFLLTCATVFAYSNPIPNPGHGADEIYISINGKNQINIQDAINQGDFSSNYVEGTFSGNLEFGHEDIFVRVNGVSKTLQQAINDKSLCDAKNGGYGSYSGSISNGHKGDDILVNFNGEKNLQQAINDGSFANCCTDSAWNPVPSTICVGTSFTQTSNCGNTRNAIGSKPKVTTCSDPAGGHNKWCAWDGTGTDPGYNTKFIRTVPPNTAAVASDTVACMNHCNSLSTSGYSCCGLWYSRDHLSTRRLLCAADDGSPKISYVTSEIHWASNCVTTC